MRGGRRLGGSFFVSQRGFADSIAVVSEDGEDDSLRKAVKYLI